ncbi:hypothetical protein RUE5091_03634 [Ruegeria denitrificans]|uniref:Uncharacterized protein n=1 Tax=Ruegeria denitrificans TaxID=1715692 RepID=A0A0P1IHT3_9RHOB|nr:hypothetical protein RUE5091_03634 [Ruegeria denitrificans]
MFLIHFSRAWALAVNSETQSEMLTAVATVNALVAETWWQNRWHIAENTVLTAIEVVVGLIVGTVLGVLTALQLASSRVARVLVQPMLVFTQACLTLRLPGC